MHNPARYRSIFPQVQHFSPKLLAYSESASSFEQTHASGLANVKPLFFSNFFPYFPLGL
jgi:hypothetical protein